MTFDVDIQETTDAHNETVEERSGVYANEEQASHRGQTLHSQPGDSSDEVDPRRLLRDPTLSELRWYYRRELGGTLVKKPIKDAFKNGFEFTGDNAEEARGIVESPSFGERYGYIMAHKMAEFKSRRDGFALLFLGVDDDTDGTMESPIGASVDGITHLSVLTVDDLTASARHEQIIENTDVESSTDYEVRNTGIVVDRRIESSNFGNPLGYVLDQSEPQFVHADRVVHYTWNEDVDGNYKEDDTLDRFHEDNALGMWEGDSVLIPSYDLLKGLAKGNWAIMQSLFRHASHLYSIELPDDANDQDLQSGVDVAQNINAKSALVMPNGWEVDQHKSGGEIDPRNFYDVIFDQICANHEMTRSVLFGTQTGTVSGSETDIKNYFNKVERYRTNRGEEKIIEYLTLAKRMLDGRTNDDFEYGEVEIDWGPLFKVDRETRLSMIQTHAQALTTLVGSYLLTPNEARAILSQEWAEVDVDSLDPAGDKMDVLDRVNMANMGQARTAEQNDPTPDTPREGGGEGGRPEGARQEGESSGTTPDR